MAVYGFWYRDVKLIHFVSLNRNPGCQLDSVSGTGVQWEI